MDWPQIHKPSHRITGSNILHSKYSLVMEYAYVYVEYVCTKKKHDIYNLPGFHFSFMKIYINRHQHSSKILISAAWYNWIADWYFHSPLTSVCWGFFLTIRWWRRSSCSLKKPMTPTTTLCAVENSPCLWFSTLRRHRSDWPGLFVLEPTGRSGFVFVARGISDLE